MMNHVGLLLLITAAPCALEGAEDIVLPPSHLPYVESLKGQNEATCWGHEPYCKFENSFSKTVTTCRRPREGGEKHLEAFFDEADFGYVGRKLKTLSYLCRPEADGDNSGLLCSEQLQFCTGRRLAIDFPEHSDKLIQYNVDVLKPGQIGGRCKVNQDFLSANSDFMSPLQSWAPELRNFVRSSYSVKKCDVTVDKPTVVMKLDATVNMYHHFCDFFNLYCSLLLNATLDPASAFGRDAHYLVWENQPYRSSFQSVFGAFTIHKIWNLETFAGKRVCFENLMFPLLPRMVFGLYYNTPFSSDACAGSGLFKAFSEFITYRMGIGSPTQASRNSIRVTILNRLTPHRIISNLQDLVTVLLQEKMYNVTVANFTHQSPPFKRQMEIIRQTDVLVGLHGAGMTHMLFLPDWAVVFELYQCDDPDCYSDLARMRGLKHVTWTDEALLEKVPSERANFDVGAAHAKFTNYKFDPQEFLRKIKEAEAHLLGHPEFVQRQLRDEL